MPARAAEATGTDDGLRRRRVSGQTAAVRTAENAGNDKWGVRYEKSRRKNGTTSQTGK